MSLLKRNRLKPHCEWDESVPRHIRFYVGGIEKKNKKKHGAPDLRGRSTAVAAHWPLDASSLSPVLAPLTPCHTDRLAPRRTGQALTPPMPDQTSGNSPKSAQLQPSYLPHTHQPSPIRQSACSSSSNRLTLFIQIEADEVIFDF